MNPSKDIQAAIEAVKEAGKVLKENFGTIKAERSKSGNAADVVTKLDVQTEEFLYDTLSQYDSSIGFKGEEHGFQKEGDKFWLVDPIDGTGFFIRGIPFCTTMIALITDGQVTGSVLYDFVRDDVYFAEKGKGSYKNNNTISVSSRTLQEAYMYVESSLRKEEDIKRFLTLAQNYVAIAAAIAGYDFIQVASGHIEARITLSPYGKDYDYAAGTLLVAEAGGIVRNIGKDSYDYTNLNFFAGNPIVYKELTEGKNALFPTT